MEHAVTYSTSNSVKFTSIFILTLRTFSLAAPLFLPFVFTRLPCFSYKFSFSFSYRGRGEQIRTQISNVGVNGSDAIIRKYSYGGCATCNVRLLTNQNFLFENETLKLSLLRKCIMLKKYLLSFNCYPFYYLLIDENVAHSHHQRYNLDMNRNNVQS